MNALTLLERTETFSEKTSRESKCSLALEEIHRRIASTPEFQNLFCQAGAPNIVFDRLNWIGYHNPSNNTIYINESEVNYIDSCFNHVLFEMINAKRTHEFNKNLDRKFVNADHFAVATEKVEYRTVLEFNELIQRPSDARYSYNFDSIDHYLKMTEASGHTDIYRAQFNPKNSAELNEVPYVCLGILEKIFVVCSRVFNFFFKDDLSDKYKYFNEIIDKRLTYIFFEHIVNDRAINKLYIALKDSKQKLNEAVESAVTHGCLVEGKLKSAWKSIAMKSPDVLEAFKNYLDCQYEFDEKICAATSQQLLLI